MLHINATRNQVDVKAASEGPISRLIAAYSAWNENRVTRNVLSRLSDRELEDIGVTRAEINKL